MTDKMVKIRLKMGQLEFDYEGDAAFLEEGIFNLLGKTAEFYTDNQDSISVASELPVTTGEASGNGSAAALELSTSTIASRLGVKSGPDLVIAAAAHLHLTQGRGTFTRKQVLTEMQGAAGYYTKSMSGNLSKSFEGLVRSKRLNHMAGNTYALTATERHSIEAKLAD